MTIFISSLLLAGIFMVTKINEKKKKKKLLNKLCLVIFISEKENFNASLDCTHYYVMYWISHIGNLYYNRLPNS